MGQVVIFYHSDSPVVEAEAINDMAIIVYFPCKKQFVFQVGKVEVECIDNIVNI